jgi:DNA mismatch repair ATPase MutS
LAHPLLPGVTRVGNDVTVGPPGTLLLVTGSNMSGKSTLLRAIGLNVVLAQAGAPVCAHSLTMPPVELRTSIRLADSLERGVSLFMAELERLKEIVVAARDDTRPRRLLYLLDEILHGTNTAERLIAARAVLGHLLRAGAIGAVTTHDLTLAADGALATASVPVHFTEQVTGDGTGPGTMTFDYRLRPGLATSTNALKLLALVGLASRED